MTMTFEVHTPFKDFSNQVLNIGDRFNINKDHRGIASYHITFVDPSGINARIVDFDIDNYCREWKIPTGASISYKGRPIIEENPFLGSSKFSYSKDGVLRAVLPKDYIREWVASTEKKCECGSEAVGSSKHSTWCAKHE